jgi:AraC-like DNA-binding protein
MPAVELVHSSPFRRVDLQRAAAACGFQRSYFDGVFRDTMGLPFSRYELRTRLSHAARLLAGADSPVAAVAEETGFVDASHFHRRFAEVYGCTPGEYRRRTADADGCRAETRSALSRRGNIQPT